MPTPDQRPRLLLPVILSATFMYGFDLNVVNVAVPSLQRDLHAGPAVLELVVGGYAFAYAAGLVTGGRLGDLFSHRRMFLAGLAAFTVASLLCGLAGTPAELVGARLLQGLAAAAMVPQVLALITAAFPAGERPRALAWFGVVTGLSGICGQVLGGLLITADVAGLGWRPIFFLNVPVGLVVWALAARVLPRRETTGRPGLDPVGVVGISGSLALALVPLVLGRSAGWPPWTWVSLAAAVPAFVAVLGWERRVARAGGAPLFDLDLFRDRSYTAGLGIIAAFMASFTSGLFTLSLLLQSGLGRSALGAGLSFGPMAVLGMAAPFVGRRLLARYGAARVIVLGCAVNGLSFAILGVALHALRGGITVAWLVGPLALWGFGGMLTLPAVIGVTLAGVRPAVAGVAAGTMSTVQQFAGVVGLAVIGTVFFAVLGGSPDRADYAAATETAIWTGLGLVAVMASLTALLPRPAPAPAPIPAPAAPATHEEATA